jgi:coenzyme Q-binding protein COQ10
MAALSHTKHLEHSWLDLFDLVLDVESYPQFVPHCSDVRLLERRTQPPSRTVIVSRMTVGFSVLRVGYANKTTADKETRRVDVTAIDGPFRYLNAIWRFEPEADRRCLVTFSVEYQFSSRVMEAVASRVFSGIFEEILGAFEHRADELFGRGKSRQAEGCTYA